MNRPFNVTNKVTKIFFYVLFFFAFDSARADKPVGAQAKKNTDYTYIQWTDLLPDEDLYALENPPEYLSEIEDGSVEDQLGGELQANINSDLNAAAEDRYQQALVSKKIRPEFNGRRVRIPGFIVPLEFDDQQTVTTFFLVPYFGACIHMPPPPPNQIIYAEFEPGKRMEALYDPFLISGTLSTTMVENELASASYLINVSAIEPYGEPQALPIPDNEYKPDSSGRMPSGP